MKLVRLNACPKCRGALFVSEDAYGPYLTCSSCGWQRDLAIDSPLPPGKENPETGREGIPDGCNIAPSCFQCPLPDCLWETPTARRAYLWDQSALALFERHKHLGTAKAVAVVAEELQVAGRTVYRMLVRREEERVEDDGN
jgi:hypothetical protein